MKIVLDLDLTEISLVKTALTEYAASQDSCTATFIRGILRHYNEQINEAIDTEFPDL